ncbi:VanZ family protein [Streptomyces sp. NPDC003327]
MFTAIFQDRYVYLGACILTSLVLGAVVWLLCRRVGNPDGMWFAGLSATAAGVLGVTFMGSGPASGQCIINHDIAEPFRTSQGLLNLAMTVPLGFFALMAVKRPLPAIVGVVTFPLAIEFTQAEVNGLGRVCDSADAQMNILGGLVGLGLAALVLRQRDSIQWNGAAKESLIAALAILLLGTGVAKPAVAFTHLDGTGLSAADQGQRQAVQEAVREAFGEHYELGSVHDQPCVGAPCRNVVFTLLSRDKKHPEAFANGTLSWPDKNRFNVLLKDSDRPSVMGYPVSGSQKPTTKEDAFQIARAYMGKHYPWGGDAIAHETHPVGDKAQLGWITGWRWIDKGVLMPRMLDVQVDKLGQVSQVNVTLGPKRLNIETAKLDAKQAESLVRDAIGSQFAGQGPVPDDLQLKAFTLKAVERKGTWRPTWFVSISAGTHTHPSGSEPGQQGTSDVWRVDALNGDLYDSADQPVRKK